MRGPKCRALAERMVEGMHGNAICTGAHMRGCPPEPTQTSLAVRDCLRHSCWQFPARAAAGATSRAFCDDAQNALVPAAAQAACWDGSAAVWRLDPDAPGGAAPAAMQLLVRFRADAAPLRTAVWVPREAALEMGAAGDPGRHLVLTAGHAGSLKFWDAGEFEPELEVPGTMSWIMCAAWLAQPLGVVAGQDHGVLRFFAIALPDKHVKSAVNTIQCAARALFADASASCLACHWGSVFARGLPAGCEPPLNSCIFRTHLQQSTWAAGGVLVAYLGDCCGGMLAGASTRA